MENLHPVAGRVAKIKRRRPIPVESWLCQQLDRVPSRQRRQSRIPCMYIFGGRHRKPQVIEGATAVINGSTDRQAMERKIVGAPAEIDVVWVGLPIDSHPHRIAVECDSPRVVRIWNPKREVAQSECRWGRHGANSISSPPCGRPRLSDLPCVRMRKIRCFHRPGSVTGPPQHSLPFVTTDLSLVHLQTPPQAVSNALLSANSGTPPVSRQSAIRVPTPLDATPQNFVSWAYLCTVVHTVPTPIGSQPSPQLRDSPSRSEPATHLLAAKARRREARR